MGDAITVERYYRGPSAWGHGGYVSGLAAKQLGGGPAEVRIRRPVPLDEPLTVSQGQDVVRLENEGEVVVEARPGRVGVDPRLDLAVAVLERGPVEPPADHDAPECFVCGPARPDGLGVFLTPMTGGAWAGVWVPDGEVPDELLWAVLDCPGGWAAYPEGEEVDFFPALAGMTAEVRARPSPGEPVAVLGWREGEDERRITCGSALVAESGTLIACSEQVIARLPREWGSASG